MMKKYVTKKKLFDNLLSDISKCEKCINLGNKSLINFYSDKHFAKNIPSIWTDWYNHLESEIFIVGQDWGPVDDMHKFYDEYLETQEWKKIIDEERSLTKKNLELFLNKINISLDDVFITNAIMCGRTGSNYRGNNINLKYSSRECSNFLKRQIDIVKPKVIVTLGYYPLYALANIYDFKIERNLKETIDKYDVFKVDDYIIIPVFHPAAQINHELQLKRYQKIIDSL